MDIRDQKVIELQEKLKQQREELSAAYKPQWRTNMIFKDGNNPQVNLHTVMDGDKIADILMIIISKHKDHQIANEILGIEREFKFGGYSFEDWIHDLKIRFSRINEVLRKQQLAELEKRLSALESDDLKKDKELAAIMEMLAKFG